VPVIDGLSPEQQFFIAWGQLRGAAESPELQRQMAKSDPHPTARYRVIGPLSNSPEFQKAFGCSAGSAMVRPPELRCVIW
jgi:endothelin-converting enzyme/putative endopeptidase